MPKWACRSHSCAVLTYSLRLMPHSIYGLHDYRGQRYCSPACREQSVVTNGARQTAGTSEMNAGNRLTAIANESIASARLGLP